MSTHQIRTLIAAIIVILCANVSTAFAHTSREVSPEELIRLSEADPRSTEELAGQLCWNEATYRVNDCIAILHIRMRSAAFRNRSLRLELIALHGDGRLYVRDRAALRSDRATNVRPGDRGSYISELRSDMRLPLGWDNERTPWTRYQRYWAEILSTATGVIHGTIADVCQGRPVRWGGRQLDARHIERHLERGEVIMQCGTTANEFLGPAR